ncbi:Usg family protein [Rhodovastum atsumiense]|uniref:Usg family protein n=1 Tax=Rhodovastum atsumiense TaxID=504468 RepID=A0A5M6IMY4_9PROT|nr:Usg family protein [Rhodovastum atsumiense]KAA5608925.1 Usg family protein [Rhodovastum atsumiense]CAH2604222.1 Usg family protein [Rhodovastum atsumiense]
MKAEIQIRKQLDGYRLTTAEILYHLPDHPSVLQSYIWQDLDIAPRFPVLSKFLDFWARELDGKLHSVRVASVGLIQPARYGHTAHLMQLH